MVMLAGLGVGLLSSVPVIGILCCLWALAGGVAAVGLYRWRSGHTVTMGMGARLGALTGLAAFVPFALIFVGRMAFRGREMREALRKSVEQALANNPDPNAAEMVQWLATPGGAALLITLTLVMFLLVFLVFSTIGGAIGSALFGQGSSDSRPQTS